ncbi:MAG: histidine phosphatase family protein [Rhodocyclaceae bacterium]|jgi:broad specificity phosphatase PhoE|nr:histidine phosphatase family protein [Rhodocyclaceae bacterium]
MVRIYLIRHGQASFRSSDYDQLSEAGVEQSRLLGDWFNHCRIPVHRIAAGGMRRHEQTAEAFFSAFPDMPDWTGRLHRDVRFNEFDHLDMLRCWHAAEQSNGASQQKSFAEMTLNDFNRVMSGALERWASGQHDEDYGEPWPVFRDRCVAAAAGVVESAQPGENVLVFTSCGTISAICRHVLNLSEEHMLLLLWQIANASVTCIVWKNGRFALSSLNSTAHIDRIGNPELLTYK